MKCARTAPTRRTSSATLHEINVHPCAADNDDSSQDQLCQTVHFDTILTDADRFVRDNRMLCVRGLVLWDTHENSPRTTSNRVYASCVLYYVRPRADLPLLAARSKKKTRRNAISHFVVRTRPDTPPAR